MREYTSNSRGRRGFTLVEAVATMSILAVVSASASRIIFAAADAYAADVTRAELTADLSTALERITAEVRSLPSRPASPGTPWIDSASATTLNFGGASTLTLNGSELRLTIGGGATRVLLKDVAAFTLAYFDEANAGLTPPLSGSACDAIRRVQVTVARTRAGTMETLRTRVYLRAGMGAGS